MTQAPHLTVVIPTHNRAGLLPDAVASVLSQSVACALVVVDDGSADGTAAWLSGDIATSVHVVRHARALGVSGARNAGAQAAASDWVLFLDDDDRLAAGALARMLDTIAASPEADWLWGARRIHDAGGAVLSEDAVDPVCVDATEADEASLMAAARAASSAGLAVRRRVFDALGGFDARLTVSEDRDLIYRLCAAGARGVRVPHVLVDHRAHAAPRLSANSDYRRQIASERRVIAKNRQFLEAHPQVFAMHLHRVASKQRHAGDMAGARRTVLRIMQLRPADMKAWRRRLVWSAGPKPAPTPTRAP